MDEDKLVEVEAATAGGAKAAEQPGTEEPTPEATTKKSEARREKTSATIKDALRQAESFAQTLGEALQGRGNVVMVRVNDEALAHLDMLVEAEVTKSRSESAAFLISEGMRANESLFVRISAITDQIAALREQLRDEVKLPSQSSEPDKEAEA